jgi:hypothetical protein
VKKISPIALLSVVFRLEERSIIILLKANSGCYTYKRFTWFISYLYISYLINILLTKI